MTAFPGEPLFTQLAEEFEAVLPVEMEIQKYHVRREMQDVIQASAHPVSGPFPNESGLGGYIGLESQ
jgi:hypothetical protein